MISDVRLLRTLVDPPVASCLNDKEWNDLISQARGAGLLSRMAVCLGRVDALSQLPHKVRDLLSSGSAIAHEQERGIRWEVNRISRALRGIDCPLVLLKGAAYVLGELPPARGRLYADVDILVPRSALVDVERALLQHGWEPSKSHEYDQHYYRAWMHELPPLRHRDRCSIVDVHHTILPLTGRLRPDPQLLFDAARTVPGMPLQILAPADMLLHSAAHLFQDGEIQGSLRDLIDLNDLLRHFSSEPGFWEYLPSRAVQLGLQRPLFYALRYTSQLLETPVPSTVIEAADAGKPGSVALTLMDALVPLALVPTRAMRSPLKSQLARDCLYVRSHWLKMPPWLLARHLLHKSFRHRRIEQA